MKSRFPGFQSLGDTGITVLVTGVLFAVAVSLPHEASAEDPVNALESSSVYNPPTPTGSVDTYRIRRLIGDRPIVVVIESRRFDVSCDAIANAFPHVLVLLMDPVNYTPVTSCGDDTFLNLDVLGPRVGDPVAYVEEAVWQYDATGSADRRRLTTSAPSPPTDVVFFAALFSAALACFACEFAYSLHRWRRLLGMRNRFQRISLHARLNRLADHVLRSDSPGTPGKRAVVGKRYVSLLRDFEAAEAPTRLAEVDKELTRLEIAAGLRKSAKKRGGIQTGAARKRAGR